MVPCKSDAFVNQQVDENEVDEIANYFNSKLMN
jgi:hypothetical protein